MRANKVSIVLAALLVAVAVAVSVAQTQTQLNQEACGEYQKEDQELNRVYQQILREYRGDALFLQRLREAQRAWLVYRDAQLSALYPERDAQRHYGSVYPMCRCLALAEITQQRAKELRRWIEGMEEGDVCGGSIRTRNQE